MFEVTHGDLSVVVRVENLESINKILQGFLIFSTLANNLLDVLAIETAALLGVDLCYHFLDFRFGRVDVEGADQIT
jgi:hypothetical protein